MTEPEWKDWASHHAALFALRTDADKEMIALWRTQLGHLSIGDLREASNELLTKGNTYRTEHVAALLRIVSEKVRARALAWESRERSFACAICWDRGLVDVPHPACIANGELVVGNFGGIHYLATVVVYCGCNVGGFKHQRMREVQEDKKGRKIVMPGTLIAYERDTCNHWRDLMDEMRTQILTRRVARMAFAASKRPRQGVQTAERQIGTMRELLKPAIAVAKAAKVVEEEEIEF